MIGALGAFSRRAGVRPARVQLVDLAVDLLDCAKYLRVRDNPLLPFEKREKGARGGVTVLTWMESSAIQCGLFDGSHCRAG